MVAVAVVVVKEEDSEKVDNRGKDISKDVGNREVVVKDE